MLPSVGRSGRGDVEHVAQVAGLEVLVAADNVAGIQPVGGGSGTCRPGKGLAAAGQGRARSRCRHGALDAGVVIGGVGVHVALPVAADQRPQRDVNRAAVGGQVVDRRGRGRAQVAGLEVLVAAGGVSLRQSRPPRFRSRSPR